MIELRWVDHGHPMDRELQFRQVINPMEEGLQPPLWSEWLAVPCVSWRDIQFEGWAKADAARSADAASSHPPMKPRIQKIGDRWSCTSSRACKCGFTPKEAYERWAASVWWGNFRRPVPDWRAA